MFFHILKHFLWYYFSLYHHFTFVCTQVNIILSQKTAQVKSLGMMRPYIAIPTISLPVAKNKCCGALVPEIELMFTNKPTSPILTLHNANDFRRDFSTYVTLLSNVHLNFSLMSYNPIYPYVVILTTAH